MMRQISQVAVCNSVHSTEQRLSHWLLLTSERARTNTLPFTHEAIAQLLSVRRESITGALGYLQSSGIIRAQRGSIVIVSASRLGAASCECYSVIKAEPKACWRYERISYANTGFRH
jgi:Crp-like helix-turn-helix domain